MLLENINEHNECIKSLVNLSSKVDKMGSLILTTLRNENKVMICGNGGSAADAQHFSSELLGRFVADRQPLAALALTTDTSALTCIGNDYEFNDVFARQVTALGKAGDILFLISTSGNSENLIKAAKAARKLGIQVISLLGNNGGQLLSYSDVSAVVEAKVTARIQEAHILIIHTLCSIIDAEYTKRDLSTNDKN
jgi:D-sedoheptulose 7-phosphate isomerase